MPEDAFGVLPGEVLAVILAGLMADADSDAVILLLASSPSVYRWCYGEGRREFRDLLCQTCPWSVCAQLEGLALSAAVDLSFHRKCAGCGVATVMAHVSPTLRCHLCRLCWDWFLVPASAAQGAAAGLRHVRRKAAGGGVQRHFLLADLVDVSTE